MTVFGCMEAEMLLFSTQVVYLCRQEISSLFFDFRNYAKRFLMGTVKALTENRCLNLSPWLELELTC